MSKNIPITTIKQASNDKLLKLIMENTLSLIDERKKLLTTKERDTLIDEANKRGLYRTVKLHYDLATAVRLLRVDLETQNWRNRFITLGIEDILGEFKTIGDIFTIKRLKPQNDKLKAYRDLIIKDLTPPKSEKRLEKQLKGWESTVIKLKQYLLEIKEVGKLFSHPVISQDTEKYIKDTRFYFHVWTSRIIDSLDELLYDYKDSPEFKAWINDLGIKRDDLKRAKAIVEKQFNLTKKGTEGVMKSLKGTKGINKYEEYIGNYPIEEMGMGKKDLAPVTEFISLIRNQYGITE